MCVTDRQDEDLVRKTKKTYDGSFTADILEQYKIYVQSAENVSSRRIAASRYLLTLSAALICHFFPAKMMNARHILRECLNIAASGGGHAPYKLAKEMVETVASSGNGAAVTVMITSLLKKCTDPGQDVRLHRSDIPGGYSGRNLDAGTVTPFLESNGFSADRRSGWSDHSFDWKAPYGFEYPGDIGGGGVREAFLSMLGHVEDGKANPRDLLVYALKVLVDLREIGKAKLDRPVGLTANDVERILEKHFKCGDQARIRLPTLAVHAAYREAAGNGAWGGASVTETVVRGTGASAFGHVKEFDPDTGFVYELVEIRPGKSITPVIVRRVRGGSKAPSANKYRLLAATPVGDMGAAVLEAERIGMEHGCQVIVSSVLDGIKWALSLLDDMDGFVKLYAGLVEDDYRIKYVHKMAWNNAVRTTLQL